MRHVIYADTLVFLNTAATFLLLLSVRQFSGVKTSIKRMIAAAFLGGAASFVMLLPEINGFLTAFVQIVVSAAVTFCAFFEGSTKRYIRCWGLFAGMTFCYGGVMYGISLTFPGVVRYRNGFGYIRIGFFGMIAILTSVYLIVCLLKRRFGKGEEQFSYEIEIKRNGMSITGRAVYDSGDFVSDCYTGKPVVICTLSFLKDLLSPEEVIQLERFGKTGELTENSTLRPRLLPVKTIGGLRMLPAFSCDQVFVKHDEGYVRIEGATAALAGEGIKELHCDALIGRQFFK